MALLYEIQRKIQADQFEYSKHAADQAIIRRISVHAESIMNAREEKLVERRVTYTLELEGRFCIVENVPARVNEETGEQYFSPATVERLHRAILGHQTPSRIIETPVYEYAE